MSNPAMASRSAPAWPRRAAQPAGVRDRRHGWGRSRRVARPAAACLRRRRPRAAARPPPGRTGEAGSQHAGRPAGARGRPRFRAGAGHAGPSAPARCRGACHHARCRAAAGRRLRCCQRRCGPSWNRASARLLRRAFERRRRRPPERSGAFARLHLGRHIVFAAGQYQPHSAAGRRLLAHELTHWCSRGGAAQVASAAPAGRVQRDAELDEAQTQACLAKAEAAIKELETTAAKPDYLPDGLKAAIKLLRQKMTEGKIKCYAFRGHQAWSAQGRRDPHRRRTPTGSAPRHCCMKACMRCTRPFPLRQENSTRTTKQRDPGTTTPLARHAALEGLHGVLGLPLQARLHPGRDAEKRFSDDGIHKYDHEGPPGVTRAAMNEVRQRDAVSIRAVEAQGLNRGGEAAVVGDRAAHAQTRSRS